MKLPQKGAIKIDQKPLMGFEMERVRHFHSVHVVAIFLTNKCRPYINHYLQY